MKPFRKSQGEQQKNAQEMSPEMSDGAFGVSPEMPQVVMPDGTSGMPPEIFVSQQEGTQRQEEPASNGPQEQEIELNLGSEDLKNLKVEEDTSEIEKQIAEKDVKIAELTKDLQRTRADFENFRKQVEVQKANERKTTKLATVYKILPLLDDLDRAINSYVELKPLEKSLAKNLKELSLIKIKSDENTDFNPDVHDAVMVEGDGEQEVVAETLRPGYYYEGEVLRPAMVKVRKI